MALGLELGRGAFGSVAVCQGPHSHPISQRLPPIRSKSRRPTDARRLQLVHELLRVGFAREAAELNRPAVRARLRRGRTSLRVRGGDLGADGGVSSAAVGSCLRVAASGPWAARSPAPGVATPPRRPRCAGTARPPHRLRRRGCSVGDAVDEVRGDSEAASDCGGETVLLVGKSTETLRVVASADRRRRQLLTGASDRRAIPAQ